ncbi:helix-turn-helix transcriptional regulator [Streptomyces sp. NPDC050610]|uniref:helix-turn-helix domain-containing protein n=1 Tax=Streptomyces sp. NPDC050610 TaxID=3157097 RepID=UPI003413A31F
MELNDEGGKLSPRVRLGRRIRRLRERKGLSLRQLSDEVGGYSHSYLGRVELGEQLPSEALVKSLDEFFDTDGVLADLLESAHDALIPDYSRKVLGLEPEAERIQVFTSNLVPALLQTREYMREVFCKFYLRELDVQIEERVEARMQRQRILEREEPPYYWGIMDEAALRRPIGGTRCMVEQLKHLLHVAVQRHITVQVLPFAAGAYPLSGGSLTLHTLPNGGTCTAIESFDSGESTEAPKRVLELVRRFDFVRSVALTDEESLELIRRYLKEYEGAEDS